MEHNYSGCRWIERYDCSYSVYTSLFKLEIHKHMIVHRDIKPANILISGDVFVSAT